MQFHIISGFNHEDLYRFPTKCCHMQTYIIVSLILLIAGIMVSMDYLMYLIYYLCSTLIVHFNGNICTPAHLCSYPIN